MKKQLENDADLQNAILSTFVTSKLALKARIPLQIQAHTIITLKSLNSARRRIKNMWNFSNTFILSYKIISFAKSFHLQSANFNL